ncbi:hypothetical protein P7H06_15350 [Paenibacillus larvae]|nr:hypothetical protein [Paenibacillus larvae]MDT2260601.1 hypothetical protein [Paenibacillus larvae]
MSTEINVLFKSMQRDDKKEVLKFELKGKQNDGQCSKACRDGRDHCHLQPSRAKSKRSPLNSMNIQRDSKKTVIKLALKGDSEEKALELYKRAGRNVPLTLKPFSDVD